MASLYLQGCDSLRKKLPFFCDKIYEEKMPDEIKPRTVYKIIRTDKKENGADIYVGSTY